MCGTCGCNQMEDHHHHSHTKTINIEQSIMAENQRYADFNRTHFQTNNILAINMVSSPGAGKTTLLVNTIKALKKNYSIYVIEGDQQTERDAERIRATQVPVVQINTGNACHLDAHRIGHTVEDLNVQENSLLFIENVGNLVCPALFDLGEAAKVVLLSVTEGDDKPLKYPNMFAASSLMIINKMDLLPYVEFNLEKCIEYAKRVNPHIEIITLSATQPNELNLWIQWLGKKLTQNVCAST